MNKAVLKIKRYLTENHFMRKISIILFSVFMISCSSAQKPTKEDVTKALKTAWERPESTSTPKQTITISEIKIGNSQKIGENYDGIPKGTNVTLAKVDFTQIEYYSNSTQQTRRISTLWMFKDAFGDWVFKSSATTYPK